MLHHSSKALVVKENGDWRYVFCQNVGRVVTMPMDRENRCKALPADFHLDYFANNYSSKTFGHEVKGNVTPLAYTEPTESWAQWKEREALIS